MIEEKKWELPFETNPETSSEVENQCKDSKILQPTVPDIKENFSAVPVAEFETPEQKPPLYFDKFRIDLSKEIEEPKAILSIGGKRILSRGDISCISGKKKSRKTFLKALLTAQIIENENSNFKVIIFDTEQSQYHAQKTPKRIHSLLEWNENLNNEQLMVFRLRELNVEERKKIVEDVINHYKPDLVFIDGIRDLVYDFNSPTESSNIVNLLMKLSSQHNCHICSVLHLNKGNSNTLRGHLGTEMENKSETVIVVDKKGEKSLVIPKDCRNIDFDEFYFKVNEKGLPELCNPELMPKSSNKLKSMFDDIFSTVATIRYSELRSKIMEKCRINDKSAEKKIKEATEQSIIIKNDGYYFLPGTDNDCDVDDSDGD